MAQVLAGSQFSPEVAQNTRMNIRQSNGLWNGRSRRDRGMQNGRSQNDYGQGTGFSDEGDATSEWAEPPVDKLGWV